MRGVLWFFTAKDHDLTRAMGQSNRGDRLLIRPRATACSRAFAGTLEIVNDRDDHRPAVDPVVAEWYDGQGRPKLALVRFDIEDAKIWKSDVEGLLKPAFNKLLGRKPEAGMKEKVAEVSF